VVAYLQAIQVHSKNDEAETDQSKSHRRATGKQFLFSVEVTKIHQAALSGGYLLFVVPQHDKARSQAYQREDAQAWRKVCHLM